jgi:hypothetical protein
MIASITGVAARPYLVLLGALGWAAADPGPLAGQVSPPPRAPTGCAAPEYRQFDFWAGRWDVTSHGQPAGTNLVTIEERGCLVHEHWTGAEGGTGQSLNFYDRRDQRWHQVWVASTGNVLSLAGRYQDSTLVLQGEAPQPGGPPLRHRLSFRHRGDGTVRQLWETSADSGTTWAVTFDGLYRRHPD